MPNLFNNSFFYKTYKFQIQLFFIYLICHGGLFLILDSVYWDDWTLFNVDNSFILSTFKQSGGAFFNFTGYLHTKIIPLGLWIYKVSTFVLFYISGLLLFKILSNNNKISNETNKFIVILFLILPFNSARVALIDFPYTIGYFLFFFAWNLKKIRLLALPIFFFSFNVNSLPFLYILVIIDLFFEKYDKISIKNIREFILLKFDYLFLPVLFFVVKYKYFTTSGLYKTYNSNFQIKNLFITPIRQVLDFTNLNINLFALIFLILVLNKIKPFKEIVNKTKFENIYLPILAFILAVFPYWILGLTPSFFEWSSRHQLLIPIGVSLFLTFFLSKLDNSHKYIFFSLILSISIIINTNNYLMFFKDWNKQKELISLIKTNSFLKDKKLILVKDNTTNYNALERTYRFYEWNGIFKFAYKNESRFFLNYSERGLYKNGYFDDYFNEFGNAKNYNKVDLNNATILTIESVEPKTYFEKLTNIFYPKFYFTFCK